MNTLSWLDMVQTHRDTKIEEYIKKNALETPLEAVSILFNVSSGTNAGRAHINAYQVKTKAETYYIPYYVKGVFNPQNEENCSLELEKAYTEEAFTALLKAETAAFISYKEAETKTKEEEAAADETAEEEKYRPTVSLDENGDEVIKVNGTNLEDIRAELAENIKKMGFASTVTMDVNRAEEAYRVLYRWQNGCDVNAVCKFSEGLFDEFKTQVTSGKPSASENVTYLTFSLKHDEDYESIRHHVEISVWEDGVRITVNKETAAEFKVKNADAIFQYINTYSHDAFKGFAYERNDENTPHVRGNITGLTKTDVIEFTCNLSKDTEKEITKEVAPAGETVKGTFERYRENQYRSTYILTLTGKNGTVAFCTETQSSLSGEQEIFSNNIPVSFLNTMRCENGNIVEYKAGKESESYKFKMVFKDGDISEAHFEGIKCTDVKYMKLTEDTKLTEEFAEKNKEAVLREAKECADTLYDFGLFKGTDKGYELEKSLTREESATILVRLLGEEEALDSNKYAEAFEDVDQDRWSYAYVMYCYENGITKGTGKETFSPEKEIDAAQFTALLMRLIGYTEVDPETALEESVKRKLLPKDKAEELMEKAVFTRSDMVQIVYNSLKTKMEDETLFADYLLEKEVLTKAEIGQIK